MEDHAVEREEEFILPTADCGKEEEDIWKTSVIQTCEADQRQETSKRDQTENSRKYRLCK